MNKEKSRDFYEILLVEDNAADILLLQEAIEDLDHDIRLHLQVVNNGEMALKYLYQQESYAAAARPDLILLDLNLPRKNGFSVLQEVKQNMKLQEIPVIVLSTSQAPEDVRRCYQLHANCFITKPSDLEDFMETVKSIAEFWLGRVRLPK